jgi:crossover junction endodeoxyribonuclease RuvC
MIIGIDPGAGGAFALLNDLGELQFVRDMPVVEVNGKRRVSAAAVAEIVKEWNPRLAIIERVGAMPKQGVSGMFAFGYSAGVLEGVCAAAGVSVVFAHPVTWKRAMGVPADKGACRLAAMRMWPGKQQLFARVKDDGRAEASLIGAYHIMQWSHAA